MMRSDTIVVSSITGIGSTILATPMLKVLRSERPTARIILLVRYRAARELVEGGKIADEIVTCDYALMKTSRERLGLIRHLRRARPDVFINTMPSNRLDKNLLAWLSGAPVRIGHRYPVRHIRNLGFLLNETVPIEIGLHDVDQNLQLLRPLEIDIGRADRQPCIWPPLSAIEAAKEMLRSWGASPLIGLHPGSSTEFGMTGKRWPPERFAKLGFYLASRHGARILVFGGPEEADLKDCIAAGIGNSASVVDEPITTTAAIIGGLDAFVSNDSGLMHIAVAMGTPTVGIFGPTDHRRTAPLGPKTAIVRAGLGCSPCWCIERLGKPFRCTRDRFECIDEISLGDVARQVEALAFERVVQEDGIAEEIAASAGGGTEVKCRQ